MKRLARPLVAAAALATLAPLFALASLPLEGAFVASEACPALQSIRKGTNPGAVFLTPGIAYTVIAKNRPEASHYRLRIEGAEPRERWVEVGCGRLFVDCPEGEGGVSAGPEPPPADHLLALSWQPAFCQTHRSKAECADQAADRYHASHFSLHGLWPQPRENVYCGVPDGVRAGDQASRWDELPPLDLTRATRDALEVFMPGVASWLHRHEWTKHGTCYGEPPEDYYRDSLALLHQVNDSGVRDLFAGRIGTELTAAEIEAAFEAEFGEGAGERVRLRCGSGGLITELWIHLRGAIDPAVRLADLLAAAPPAGEGCAGGRVDAAGF